MARLTDLVKTYKLLNGPKAPDWNVKFAGAVFVVLLAAVALVAVAALPLAGEPDAPATIAQERDAEADVGAPTTKTDYVGVDPADVASADPAALEDALDRWHAEHPDARVVATEPVVVGGEVVGYHVVYEE